MLFCLLRAEGLTPMPGVVWAATPTAGVGLGPNRPVLRSISCCEWAAGSCGNPRVTPSLVLHREHDAHGRMVLDLCSRTHLGICVITRIK